MENPGNQSEEATGAVEDPPPPTTSAQEQSTSESSSQPQQQQERRLPPPLSPLTGSYLLIVVGEPHSERHKEIILQKIAKAFLSWDVSECHVSLEKELQVITAQSPEGEEARYGERLIQYATENLVTEILIHPQLNTLHQCLKNLLSSFTKHRLIIHAGYTFAGNGSWILQDGTLSISDLVEALHEPDVLRVLKAYENSVSIDVHCAPEGDWTTERFQKEPVSKLCSIRINPGDVMTAGNPAISMFIDYLSPFLEPANIQQLLQPTDVVGNIRFTHPTLYVFPGGQGDAALFGINGFNMLIDGGFARKACFWDFARHLDRLDAVLLTRLNNSTVNGISAVLQRKKLNHVYPQIGHFFCNLQDRKIALSPDGDKDKDSLIVNLAEEGQEIVANLKHLALKPHPCYRDGNQVDPVNLYHKVGHGKLDMYVISPARDSLAVKEFLAKWSSNDDHLFSNTGKKIPGKSFEFPLQNLVSICALLVWQPANPNDTITRILFPGSTPQHKIFEGLEKLRHLEFLKHPVCSAKSISPSVSTTTVQRSLSKTRQQKPPDNKQKEGKISKSQLKPAKPKTEKTPLKESKSKLDNKLADEKNELENVEEPLKKLDNRILSKDEQIENIKKEIQKIEQAENEEHKKKIIHRSKYDMRNVKPKVDSRAPSKSIDRKKVPEKKPEGEASPPATPKKGLANGTVTKMEKAKIGAKQTKAPSPASTPAKSAKEANNRKVVEARVTTKSLSKSITRKKEETPPPLPSTTAKTERKTISRRPKAPLSPAKTFTGKSAKTEPESISKKVKKKTEIDSSVIKAASQIISTELQKDAETEKTDLKEGKIEIKKLEEVVTENKETDVKAVRIELQSAQTEDRNLEEDEEEEEEEEEEEYLIITKEEYGEESAKEEESGKENEEELQTKDETEGEGEMKKLLREEEESEKKREINESIDLKSEDENEKREKRKEETEENLTKIKEKVIDEGNKENEKMKKAEAKKAESPREKTSEGRESELQKLMEVDEGIDLKEPVSKEHKEGESLPEEKMSNTLETSATTAPTLPEDERMEEPVEEKDQAEDVKEVIEEKYIQEKTKEEKQEEEIVKHEQDFIPKVINVEVSPVPIQLTHRKHPRDVVKTPDEVAELPMHEEVDPRLYSSGDFIKELQRKSEEEKHDKPDFKAMVKGEANFLDEEDVSESEDSKKILEQEPERKKNQVEDSVITKYLNIIDGLEKSGTESKKDSVELESSPKSAFIEDKIKEDETEKFKSEELENIRTDKNREPSSQIEEVDAGRISGKNSPGEVEKIVSGKTTTEVLNKEISGVIMSQELEKKPRISISEDSVRHDFEKSAPQDLIGELPGKSSPEALVTEVSGKSTSQELIKEVSLVSTPHELVKEMSERSASHESEKPKDTNEKFSSQDLENISGVSVPSEHEISTLEKSTPPDIKNQISAEGTLGQELEKIILTESFPQDIVEETWKDSTTDSKTTDVEVSRESVSQDLEKIIKEDIKTDYLPISGKSTTQDLQRDVLNEKNLIKLEKDISREPASDGLIKEISEKFTAEESYKVVSEEFTPQTVEKEISSKSTPIIAERGISRELAPQDYEKSSPLDLESKTFEKTVSLELEKDSSEKPILQDVDISEKSISKDSNESISPEPTSGHLQRKVSEKFEIPNLEEVFTQPISISKDISVALTEVSGKSSSQILIEETPGKTTSEKLFEEVSGKPVTNDLEKKVSEKLIPSNLEKDFSRKSLSNDLSKGISREPSPHELSKDITREPTPHELSKDISREPTPHELSKDISREPTPHELSKDISREPSPHELSKDITREPTPHELSKDISREPTPHKLSKDISREPTPHELSKDISREPTPHKLSKDISREPTPHELSKDISREPTPHELSKDISREPTPHELSKDISREPTPHELSKDISREHTPHELSKDISKESTSKNVLKEPSSSLNFREDSSKKFILQELDKTIPDSPVLQNLGKDELQISTPSHCEISAQELEKQISDITSTEALKKNVSRKTTPEKEILERDTPSHLEKESSRKISPYDSDKFSYLDEEKSFSRKNSPIEAEKSVSGRITPCDIDSNRTASQIATEKVISYEDEKSLSSKSSRRESLTEYSNRRSPGSPSSQTSQDLGSIRTISTHLVEDISSKDKDFSVSEKTNKDFIKNEKINGEEKDKSEKIIPQEVIKQTLGEASSVENVVPFEESLEKSENKILSAEEILKKTSTLESSVSDSVSSGPGEKDVSGKSTPFSTDKEISGKISPVMGGKVTSDSFSLALAEKGTSGTYSSEKESSEKISSPSPVDISPLSLDELKDNTKEKKVLSDQQKEGKKSMAEIQELGKSQLERVKYEHILPGTSTPDKSQYKKSETSLLNGVESEDEPEKGILENEKQEKESQILDISSGEEEELKALGDDEDSEPEMRKDDLERGIILSKEIAKEEKEDINKLVKISADLEVEEEQDSDYKTGVKRMLVTASSEDGGTETEICIQSGVKVEKEDEENIEKDEGSEEGEFSNLILQARREYNAQRSRKTSCNSSEDVEEAEESIKLKGKDTEEEEEEEKDDEDEEEELGTLLKQARQEIAFLRSKNREMAENELIKSEKKLGTVKTTTRSETVRTDDDIITITTILTEEREEQEDGSVRVTITKETTTEGGKDEGTVVIVNTNIEKKEDKKLDEEESSSQMNFSTDRQSGTIASREDSEKKTSQEEIMETSRRTSASSIISQEDLVSRKDSAKIEDFRQSSTEMSPLKTTYITSHGDSESLMTSSFYGNLPTEDEMIGRAEHLREFRKGRGYESFTEVGPNGERTERTYFYGGDGDPGTGREKSRFVKAYYTEEGQQKDGEQSRFVHKYYAPGIPEEESVERSRFVQRFYAEEPLHPESEVKYTFVETLSEESPERMDFAKAIDEHISARGEYLGKEFKEDVVKFANGKSKEEAEGETSGSLSKEEEEEKKKDLIEGWGKPLGLPLPPKNMNRTYAFPGQNISTTSTLSTPTDNSDSVSNWGHPMNLPSPAPPPAVNGIVDTLPEKTINSAKETPKKEKKIQPRKNVSGDNKSSGTNTPNRRSESPVKQLERRTPSTGRSNKTSSNSYVYLDLTYVPHHGNSYYSNVEFFKKVRARYYVFSGTEPSKEVYNALLEAKQTWEDKKLEVTIIPTYDTDVLGYWVAENEEILAKHKIDLSPSASRCTINLQDHETSCSAYRLEF